MGCGGVNPWGVECFWDKNNELWDEILLLTVCYFPLLWLIHSHSWWHNQASSVAAAVYFVSIVWTIRILYSIYSWGWTCPRSLPSPLLARIGKIAWLVSLTRWGSKNQSEISLLSWDLQDEPYILFAFKHQTITYLIYTIWIEIDEFKRCFLRESGIG